MPTEPLPPITRPNGKVYQPRMIQAHAWEDPWVWDGAVHGVLILGTHDLERATSFATEMCRYWFGVDYAVKPRVGWWRDGFESGERRWIYDDERGRAGIFFDADDEPPAPPEGG